MNISVESDVYTPDLYLTSTAGITYIIGLMINFFIVGVSVNDWLRGRPLTTADRLITAISTSRIPFQFITLSFLFCKTFSKKYYTGYYKVIIIIGSSSIYCNIWLSVLLSVFYTLKISNFNNVVFLYLKNIISQRFLGLAITCVLLSISFSLFDFLKTHVTILKDPTKQDILFGLLLLCNLLPFFIYTISSFALLGSLCNHMYKMKRNKNVTSHQDTYFKTIRFTIVSFVFFTLYMSLTVFAAIDFSNFSFAGLALALNIFPMSHSMYIIYMTGRLRRHFLKIYHSMTKCLLSRGSESRAGVQLEAISL